jgi:hypothetical protein
MQVMASCTETFSCYSFRRMVLFSRNHNVCTTLSKDVLLAQDELLQTARLVNCGWFGSGKLYASTTLRPRWVFLKPATSCIFGLLLEHPWARERCKQLESESVRGASVRPFSFPNLAHVSTKEIRVPDHSIVERGQGNVCSYVFISSAYMMF